MIRGTTPSGRELVADTDHLDQEPIGAGPFAGAFSRKYSVVPYAISFLVASTILFALCYITSGYGTSPFEIPTERDTAMGFWILGWVTAAATILFLLLALAVWSHKRTAREEALFKTEPRDYDFNVVGPVQPEVIKVRCRYCGTLNHVHAKNCIACGATL